jgi:ubiquitin carboxyl-terminal hydrolase 5/13
VRNAPNVSTIRLVIVFLTLAASVYSFEQDSISGVEVCLTCFNGGCLEDTKHHARTHVQKSGHPFTLNVKRKLKPSAQRVSATARLYVCQLQLSLSQSEEEEPPAKMTKLAITEDREEDKYEHLTTIKCWRCDAKKGSEIVDAASDPKVCSSPFFFVYIYLSYI